MRPLQHKTERVRQPAVLLRLREVRVLLPRRQPGLGLRQSRPRRLRPGREHPHQQLLAPLDRGLVLLHELPHDPEDLRGLLREHAVRAQDLQGHHRQHQEQAESEQPEIQRRLRGVPVLRFLRVLRAVPHHVAGHVEKLGNKFTGDFYCDVPADGLRHFLVGCCHHHHHDDHRESGGVDVLVAHNAQRGFAGQSCHGCWYCCGVLLAFGAQFLHVRGDQEDRSGCGCADPDGQLHLLRDHAN